MKSTTYGLAVGVVALAIFVALPAACVRPADAPQPSLSVTGGVAGACAAAQVGMLVSPELEVLAIQPGSAAAAAGVQVGDRLVSFDGFAFASQADAIYAVLSDELTPPCYDTVAISLDPPATATMAAQVQQPAPTVDTTPTPVAIIPPPIDYRRRMVVNRGGAEQVFEIDLSIQPDYRVVGPLVRPAGPVQPDWLYF